MESLTPHEAKVNLSTPDYYMFMVWGEVVNLMAMKCSQSVSQATFFTTKESVDSSQA